MKSEDRYKITGARKAFLISRFAAFETNAGKLAEQLGDKGVAAEFDFEPVSIRQQSVYFFLHAAKNQGVLLAAREKYLSDLQSIKIFHPAVRLCRLEREWQDLESGRTSMTGKEIRELRLKILSEAHKQSGEEIDKLVKALERSGNHSTVFNFTVAYGKLSDDDKQSIRRDLAESWRW